MSWSSLILALPIFFGSVFILQYFLIPYILESLTPLRFHTVSLRSVRGIEWRPKQRRDQALPTLRIDRVGWSWSKRCEKTSGGWFTLKIEGLTLRLDGEGSGDRRKSSVVWEDDGITSQSEDETTSTYRGKMGRRNKSWIKRQLRHWSMYFIGLAVNHSPWLAHLFDIEFINCRVLLEPTDGLVFAVANLRAGLTVSFDDGIEQNPVNGVDIPTNVSSYVLSPASPFSDPYRSVFSPPATSALSPPSYFACADSASDVNHRQTQQAQPRTSKFRRAGLQASKISSMMSSKAGKMWTRAIGKAQGSASLCVAVEGVSLYQSGSRSGQHSPTDGASSRSRTNSNADESIGEKRNDSYINPRLLSHGRKRKPTPERSIVAQVKDRSHLTVHARFGRWTLLGGNTVQMDMQVAPVECCADRLLLLRQKNRKFREPEKVEEEDTGIKVKTPSTITLILVRAIRVAQITIPSVMVRYAIGRPDSSPSRPFSELSSTDSGIGFLEELNPEGSSRLTLEVVDLQLGIRSATVQDSTDMRDIYGTYRGGEALARGIIPSVQFGSMVVNHAPVDKESRQVLRVRELDVGGLTTRIHQAWEAGKIFLDNPNYAVVQLAANISRVDCNVSTFFVSEVRKELERIPSTPRQPASKAQRRWINIPRIGIALKSGPIIASFELEGADGAVTFDAECDEVSFGAASLFRFLCAKRRDKAASKAAFKQEEALQSRRSNARFDGCLSDSMTLKELRRTFSAPGVLQDDMSIALDVDGGGSIGPIKVVLHSATGQSIDLLNLSSLEATGDFSVLGADVDTEQEQELVLYPATMAGNASLANTGCLEVNLWRPEVRETLLRFSSQRIRATEPSRAPRGDLFDILPSGIHSSLSFGKVNIVVAHIDPNPECQLKLTRGIRLQTAVSVAMCYYDSPTQTRLSRHRMMASERSKLGLAEECVSQALGLANVSGTAQSSGAAVVIHTEDLMVEPVHNAYAEDHPGHPVQIPSIPLFPLRKREPSAVGWDFQRLRTYPKKPRFANAQTPLDLSPQSQARRPIILIPKTVTTVSLQRPRPGSPIDRQISVRITKPTVTVSMTHAYCVLLALECVRTFQLPQHGDALAKKKPKAQVGQVAMDLHCDSLQVEASLPLEEQLFGRLRYIHVSSGSSGLNFSSEGGVFYVPSTRAPGRWEEFMRFKTLAVKVARQDKKTDVDVRADAFRIRIPFGYELSKLILNLNVSVKAMKLLLKDLRSPHFGTVRKPGAEDAKHIPNINIVIGMISLDIKDDPLETRLNLIWRVGLLEQGERLDRDAAYDAKIAAIHEKEAQGATPESLKKKWGFDGRHTVSASEAEERLNRFNSDCWVQRFRSAITEQGRREGDAISKAFGNRSIEANLPIDVMAPERTAPLFRAKIQALKLNIQTPDLTTAGVIKHMEDLGGAFPPNQEFSLLVPLDIHMDAAGIECTLRDYPVPLWRVPAMTGVKKGNLPSEPAFIADMRLVIGEELAGDDSYILIPCPVIPKDLGQDGSGELVLQVGKTIMPVKTYAQPKIHIRTPSATDFMWGQSYQPAIQDLTKVFETFTTAPRDPSPKVGFWDKIRLVFHWKISVDFDGPLHLHLKGSRDPYHITGDGAGFVLAWEGDARLRIGCPNEQRDVIQIISQQMILSVPDLTAFLDTAATGSRPDTHPDAGKSASELPKLLDRRLNKTCAKFVNGVRVGFGFVFERTCRQHTCEARCMVDAPTCRYFDLLSHHKVVLRTPESIVAQAVALGRTVDSYEGFRSDYIHFSLSLETLGEKSPSNPNDESSSFHFTPKGFAHFFAWWRLFNHVMSLPIRQGKLFPLSPPPSKKFGRSLATIKYRFDIAQLFICHTYFDHSSLPACRGEHQYSYGVKAKIGRFQADLHQREQKKLSINKKLNRETIVAHKPFYAAEVLLNGVSVRALAAIFAQPSLALDGDGSESSTSTESLGLHVSELQSSDKVWYNFDDYVDTDTKPEDHDPRLEMHTIGYCPNFLFSRWVPAQRISTEAGDSHHGFKQSDVEASRFGKEKTHKCLIGENAGVEIVQGQIVEKRMQELECESQDPNVSDGEREERARRLAHSKKVLTDHLAFLQNLLEHPIHHIDEEADTSIPEHDRRGGMKPSEGANFENVYHVHNPGLSLCNASRNIVMKYYLLSRMRRSYEYHMSNRALVVLRDQLSDKESVARNVPPPVHPSLSKVKETLSEKASNALTQGIVKLLLGDIKIDAEGPESRAAFEDPRDKKIDPKVALPSSYLVQKSHFLVLFHPQITLHSDVDSEATMLLAVEAAAFRGFTVIDNDCIGDAVNSHVMHRNYAVLRGLQGFYPNKPYLDGDSHVSVPLEVMLDSKSYSPDFDRVIAKTDATLRYDKFNQLRIRNNMGNEDLQIQGHGSDHLKHHQDLAIVNVPRFAVSADSKHYGALYNVVTNLILYQDPTQRSLSERLQTYQYSFDRQASQRLTQEASDLQVQLRSLQHLVREYDEHLHHLTRAGKEAIIAAKQAIVESTDALHVLFEAVAVAQTHDAATAQLKSSLRLEAYAGEIAWHMMAEHHANIAKLAIKGIGFSWLSKNDGSTENAMIIKDLQMLNSAPEAAFREMVTRSGRQFPGDIRPFLTANWSALAPVGGISIIKEFYLDLHPMRIQLEKRIGDEIMTYVFQDRRAQKEGKGSRPPSRSMSGISTPRYGPAELTDAQSENLAMRLQKVEKEQTRGAPQKMPPITRQTSGASGVSNASVTSGGLIHRHRSNTALNKQTKKDAVGNEVAEMRARASRNRTFVSIKVVSTVLVISYKGGRGSKLPDLYDVKYHTPEFIFENRTCSFEDLVQDFKKDIARAAWSQKGALIRDIVRKGRHKPAKANSVPIAKGDNTPHEPSALRYTATLQSSPSESSSISGSQLVLTEDGPEVQAPLEEADGSPVDNTRFMGRHAPRVDGKESKGRVGKLLKKLVNANES